jgi:hypothetical protein
MLTSQKIIDAINEPAFAILPSQCYGGTRGYGVASRARIHPFASA